MKLAPPYSLLWGWSWRINSTSRCVLDQHVINSGVRRLLQSKVRNMNAKPTTHQQLLLQQQRNSLWCSIESWREIQRVYLPFTSQYHEPTTQADDDTDALSSKPEKLLLHLPSSLLASLKANADVKHLLEIETRLRVAQADDALEEIRRYRRVVTGVHHFKKANLSGNGNKKNTRARDLMSRYVQKIKHCADRYHAARTGGPNRRLGNAP